MNMSCRSNRWHEDWAIVRLGSPGVITEIDVDTSFFTGNFPERCRIDACGLEGYPSVDALQAASWDTVVDWTDLRGDSHNVLPVSSTSRYTHIRLVIATDGGVARLRVNGDRCPDPLEVDGLTVDLAGRFYGGEVESSSDNFYSTATVLNHPHLAQNMWVKAGKRPVGAVLGTTGRSSDSRRPGASTWWRSTPATTSATPASSSLSTAWTAKRPQPRTQRSGRS
jgi:allantoicase